MLFVYILGISGISLVFSKSTFFDPARSWLLSFKLNTNPLKIVGCLISSPAALGVVFGFAWCYATDRPYEFAGLVGLASFALSAVVDAIRQVLIYFSNSRGPSLDGRGQSRESVIDEMRAMFKEHGKHGIEEDQDH